MTRVLQIRRGTTAEHENFVGMPGEITMDTDKKTIRLHDGQTLGGFVLGENSTANSSGDFDINSVPDEFWANIVAKHTGQQFNLLETTPVPINNNCSYIEYILDTDKKPKFIIPALICQSGDAGYNTDEEVWAFGIGNRCNPTPNYFLDADGLHVCQMVGGEKFWVSHKNTGVTSQITDNTKWKIIFRVYC